MRELRCPSIPALMHWDFFINANEASKRTLFPSLSMSDLQSGHPQIAFLLKKKECCFSFRHNYLYVFIIAFGLSLIPSFFPKTEVILFFTIQLTYSRK